jgi:predicted DNA-binding transcriptional regulator AlpA
MRRINTAPRVDLPQLLNERELAPILGVSLPTLRRWRAKNQGPPVIKISGRLCRYSLHTVFRWLASHEKAD